MTHLIVGSAEAAARAHGVEVTAEMHAVATTDYRSLCGAQVVFVFLNTPFPAPDKGGRVCLECRALVA